MNGQKIFLIVLVVVVLGVGGYLYATGAIGGGGSKSSGVSALTSSNTGTNPANTSSANAKSGAEIATLLNSVSRIDLNGAIFNDPSFLSLTDSSIILPPVSTDGRINPFVRTGAVTLQ